MSTSDNSNFDLDPELVRKASDRAQPHYAEHAEVPDTIAERLYERLSLLKEPPARVLDIGTGDGRHLAVLRQLFPRAKIVGADLSLQAILAARRTRFWQRSNPVVCLDARVAMPFADGCFDLIVSNLAMPWIWPAEVFAGELNRLLSDSGAFFLSSVGPDTLIELRAAWQKIDTADHVNAFLDMHDVGDLLHRAGISDPVMDTERMSVTYSSLDKLLADLINTGCTNVLQGRRRGLTGSDIRQRLAQAYAEAAESDLSTADITATLEVVYAHGWKGIAKKVTGAHGEFVVNIDQLKGLKGKN